MILAILYMGHSDGPEGESHSSPTVGSSSPIKIVFSESVGPTDAGFLHRSILKKVAPKCNEVWLISQESDG